MNHDDDRILAFSHIPKTAGSSWGKMMKRHFGVRHIDVSYRRPPPVYMKRDLLIDISVNPYVRSIQGHTLQPFVDFGDLNERLKWYTLVRNPVDRFISHYQHQYNSRVGKFRIPFLEWMNTYNRSNWMVNMIAGEEDFEAAKQILEESFVFVGVMECFRESLLAFRNITGLDAMDITYDAHTNTSRDDTIRNHIIETLHIYLDSIIEQNILDLKLYEFVLHVQWPKYLAAYGEERMRRDLEVVFSESKSTVSGRFRLGANVLYRNLVYKPVVWCDRVSG